jgi:hypothetical protein
MWPRSVRSQPKAHGDEAEYSQIRNPFARPSRRRPPEALKTLPGVVRTNRGELHGIARLNRVSIGVQIVNAVEGLSSVWGNRSGSVRVAIWQTHLTSNDTMLTWMRPRAAAVS